MEIVIFIIIIVVLLLVAIGKIKGTPEATNMSEAAIMLRLKTEGAWIAKYLRQTYTTQQRASLKRMFEEKSRYIEELNAELANHKISVGNRQVVEVVKPLIDRAEERQHTGKSVEESLKAVLNDVYPEVKNEHTIPQQAPTLPTLAERAESGDPEAQYVAGCTIIKDPNRLNEGIQLIKKSAAQGFANAQHELGIMMLLYGSSESDVAQSITLFTDAAKNGHGIAPFFLSKIYEHGIGIDANADLAKEWSLRTPLYAGQSAERAFRGLQMQLQLKNIMPDELKEQIVSKWKVLKSLD